MGGGGEEAVEMVVAGGSSDIDGGCKCDNIFKVIKARTRFAVDGGRRRCWVRRGGRNRAGGGR